MSRPCFLVIDAEYPGAISTRKLVIESAKMNVLTAYSANEGVATLERFPRVNGVVLNADVKDIPCEELLQRLRAVVPSVPIVVTSGGAHRRCGPGAYFHVDSLDPKQLLDTLQKIDPAASSQILQHDEALSRE